MSVRGVTDHSSSAAPRSPTVQARRASEGAFPSLARRACFNADLRPLRRRSLGGCLGDRIARVGSDARREVPLDGVASGEDKDDCSAAGGGRQRNSVAVEYDKVR